MTEEEKKEFEEFLQWKAEKKKREEEEKREQEEREKAELAKQESLIAEQAKANTQAANSSKPNKLANEKSDYDKFAQKALYIICCIVIATLLIILAIRISKHNNSPATVAKENIENEDSIDASLAAQTEMEEEAAYSLDSIRKADRIDQVKHSVKIIKAYLSSPNSAGGVDAHLVLSLIHI